MMRDVIQVGKRLTQIRSAAGIVVVVVVLFMVQAGAVVAQTADVVMDGEAVFATDDAVQVPFDAHQIVLNFVPGANAALHQHGGPGYITMLSGELLLDADGDERVYKAGDSFVEVPESLYEGWNMTDEPASLIVTYLVPKGHDVTTYIQADGSRVQQAPPPEPLAQSVFNITSAPEHYQVVHQVPSLAPDESMTVRDERGQTYITVVSGELTAADGTVYGPGDTLVEAGDEGQSLTNAGSEPVVFAVTLLLPADADEGWSRYGGVAIIVAAGGIGIAGGGLLLRRRKVAA